jgi:hypothetical protein
MMAYIRSSVPSPNVIREFSISDFSGGLNNRTNLTLSNEASDMLNMSFYDTSVLEKRKGSMLYSVTTHTEAITFLDEYEPYNAENQMVRAGKTKMTIDNNGVLTTVALSGGSGVDAENFLGLYLFCDGAELKCYGTYPQATDTFNRVIGVPTGGYKVMTVVSTPTTYTPLGTTYAQGVTVYDYTNSKIWYEPCQNERDDPYKGYSVVPLRLRYIASMNGRIYASGDAKDDDNIFITDVGNPFYFPPSLPIQIPPNSDAIRGMVVYNDSVIIGRKQDLHIIIGETNNPNLGITMFQLKKLNAHSGFASNRSVTVAHNYLFYVGYDGNCYAMNNTSDSEVLLVTTVLNKKVDFMGDPFALTHTDISDGCAYFFDNVWYVSIGGYVFCYYYLNQAWTVWSNLAIRSFYAQDYTLLWGNEYGQTCKFSTDYLDQGTPIYAFWLSGSIDLNEPYLDKYFRNFFIVSKAFRGYFSPLNITFDLDYMKVYNKFTIENQLALFGTAKFGDKWAANETNYSLPFTLGRRARTIKIRIESGLDNTALRFYQINGEYELRGKR